MLQARFIEWLEMPRAKFFEWRERYGIANEHNTQVPRDFWLLPKERQPILDFNEKNPLEGYRRIAVYFRRNRDRFRSLTRHSCEEARIMISSPGARRKDGSARRRCA